MCAPVQCGPGDTQRFLAARSRLPFAPRLRAGGLTLAGTTGQAAWGASTPRRSSLTRAEPATRSHRRTKVQRLQEISAAIAADTIACSILQSLDRPRDLNERRSNWPRPRSGRVQILHWPGSVPERRAIAQPAPWGRHQGRRCLSNTGRTNMPCMAFHPLTGGFSPVRKSMMEKVTARAPHSSVGDTDPR
jgi:hypothetical protein